METSLVRVTNFAVWSWTMDVEDAEVRGLAGREPLPPLAPDYAAEIEQLDALGERRSPKVRKYNPAPTPCSKKAGLPHLARLEIPENASNDATGALSRKAVCLYCGEQVPPMRSQGRIVRDWLVASDDGLCVPGMMMYLERREADGPPSPQALTWSFMAKSHVLVVMLPDESKWDLFSEVDEGEGWTITGMAPNITTTPLVDTGKWKGRILDGELVQVV